MVVPLVLLLSVLFLNWVVCKPGHVVSLDPVVVTGCVDTPQFPLLYVIISNLNAESCKKIQLTHHKQTLCRSNCVIHFIRCLALSGKDIPITCAPGESRLIKARTLLPGSIGTIVMIVEVNVDNIMVYGSTPLRMLKPQGSHVCNFSVTFDEMVGIVERSGVCGRQSVVPSVTAICAQKHGKPAILRTYNIKKLSRNSTGIICSVKNDEHEPSPYIPKCRGNV